MKPDEFVRRYRGVAVCLWAGLLVCVLELRASAQDELDLEATLTKPKVSGRAAGGAGASGGQTNSAENAAPAVPLPAARDVDFAAFDAKSFSSVGAGDGFLFNSNAAVVLMQKADPKDFREIVPSKGGPSQCVADEQMPVILQNSPETSAIYADGRLFTRTFDGILCYDLRRGDAR